MSKISLRRIPTLIKYEIDAFINRLKGEEQKIIINGVKFYYNPKETILTKETYQEMITYAFCSDTGKEMSVFIYYEEDYGYWIMY